VDVDVDADADADAAQMYPYTTPWRWCLECDGSRVQVGEQ
jgi:hypothetical protein